VTEERLLAAIVETPDDDGPRLVYADWLLGRNDPRGELIALQCALARADAAGTPLPDEAGAAARERELLAQCRPQLLAGLPELAGYVVRRGFVEHAAVIPPSLFSPMDAAGFPRADLVEEMRAAAPLLRSLALTGPSLERAVPGPAWRALEALSLVEPDTQNAQATLLVSPHLAGLRRLSLINVFMEPPIQAIPQALEHLAIYGGAATQELDGDMIAAAIGRHAPLAGLRSLQLGRFRFTSVTALRELAERPIEQLALHQCGEAERVLALLRALPRLHTLELYDQNGNLGKLDLVELLCAAPGLRRLRVSEHLLDEKLVKAFAASPRAAQLRRLELTHCKLHDRAVKLLLTSGNLRSLERLDLTGTSKSAAAMTRAARLAWRPLPLYPPIIENALRDRNLIAAIKEYRALGETGLRMAKSAIERIDEELELGKLYFAGAVTRWVR
jgi:uncharacterized protein (TIGR02996 family)